MSGLINKLKIVSGFDKVENFMNIVKFNGGVLNSIKRLYLQDDLKIGTLVGKDEFGNQYFENPYYFHPRNRWVIFNEERGLGYNASQVPPEWHRWLTHMGEYPPTVEKPVHYPWMLKHQENMTGTAQAYMPHSTTRQKIQAWKPAVKPRPAIAPKS